MLSKPFACANPFNYNTLLKSRESNYPNITDMESDTKKVKYFAQIHIVSSGATV